MVFLVLFGINTTTCTGITKIDDLLLNLSADLKYQIYRIPQGHVNSICWTKREVLDCLEVIFTILYPTSTSCGPRGEGALKTVHLGMFLVTQTALHFGLEEFGVRRSHKLVGHSIPNPLPCTDFPQNYIKLPYVTCLFIHKMIPTQYREKNHDPWRELYFFTSSW